MVKKFSRRSASEFSGISSIEYFDFEEDFIEKNIRCIPMIVRFKLDKAGIKLKLDEWTRLVVDERIELASRPCGTEEETREYRAYLYHLVRKRSAREATVLAIDEDPAWADLNKLPALLNDKLRQEDWHITLKQWRHLTNLQRFALLKLCKPGHESKNFPKALREFGLISGLRVFNNEKEEHEIIGYHKD